MKFMSIKEAMEKGKGAVAVRGWIYRERGSNKFKFLVLRDSTDIIQCIVVKEQVGEKIWKDAVKLLIESSVEIEGKIREEKRAPTGFEIDVEKLKVVQFADTFPITKDQSQEFLLDIRHLSLRSRRITAVLKIRDTVFHAFREYFREQGFYEYHSPIFQSTQCEGGSTLFEVKYFGREEVFLSQSWQLYAEPAIFALEKVFTIAPSFRAEKSKTARHLTEYWHAEMEVAWSTFEDIQEYGEGAIKHVVKSVLEKNLPELEILERDLTTLKATVKKKFPRMTYTEALDILKRKCKMDVPWGKDLRTIEEDKLSKLYDTPILVTDYPKAVKAFYMKESSKDPRTVQGYDCIAPEGYGEVIGGSQREDDYDKVVARLKEMGEKVEDYTFYLDTRKYGSVPHGGYGLGVERIVSWVCGLDSIKDAIPFPRTMLRTTP